MSVMHDQTRSLPGGSLFVIERFYSSTQSKAALALLLLSCFDLVALIILSAVISVSTFSTSNPRGSRLLARAHVGSHFLSLIVTLFFQALGGIMSSKWIAKSAVMEGSLCTIQGFIKHLADVSTAVWILIIAATAANGLYQRAVYALQDDHRVFGYAVRHYTTAKWAVTAGAWIFIIVVLALGPATANSRERGSFYGISDDWCWITDRYGLGRAFLAFLIMFLSALFSFATGVVTFLRRHRTPKGATFNQNKGSSNKTLLVEHMALYPVVYFVCAFPIVAVRFVSWSGGNVPYGSIIFTNFLYLMTGIATVVIFFLSSRTLPSQIHQPQQPSPQHSVELPADDRENSYLKIDGSMKNVPELPTPQLLHRPTQAHIANDLISVPLSLQGSHIVHVPLALRSSGNLAVEDRALLTTSCKPSLSLSQRSSLISLSSTEFAAATRPSNESLPRRPMVGLPSGPAHYLQQHAPGVCTLPQPLPNSEQRKPPVSHWSTTSLSTASSFSPTVLHGRADYEESMHYSQNKISPRDSSRLGSRLDVSRSSYASTVSSEKSHSNMHADDESVVDSHHTGHSPSRPASRASEASESIGVFKIVTRPESYIPPRRLAESL